MTTTAYDDQYAPEPGSRESAIESMALDIHPHEWRQGGHMRYLGHLITWGEYAAARKAHEEVWHQAQDELADAWDEAQGDPGSAASVRLWDEGEGRIDRIAQSDGSGAHYEEAPLEQAMRDHMQQAAEKWASGGMEARPDPQHPKQVRYRDSEGDDWIDEFARSSTPEEFRGAMRFTVGKYLRRVGKKDAELSEVRKMRDYCQRWEAYLMKREGEE